MCDHLMHISFQGIQLRSSHSLPSHSFHPKMARRVSPTPTILLLIAALMAAYSHSLLSEAAADTKASFEENFDIMWSEDHFTTSDDGQIWYLSLDKETGIYIHTCTKINLSILETLYYLHMIQGFIFNLFL